jgi:putative hydrolase of the HAD superfamily
MSGHDREDVLDANASPLLRDRGEHAPPMTEAQHADPAVFAGVRAIFFDLDDTLCGYWDASKSGLRRAFDEHGPEGFTSEECVRAWAAAFREFAPRLRRDGWYDGYLLSGEASRTEQMRLTLHRLGIIDEELARRLSTAYMQYRDASLRLFEDALHVLETLKTTYPLGLITNGPADIQRMEIATLGIGHLFDHILIEGEMGEGKPKPSVFRRAASLASVDGDLLMVGNSYRHDILAAIDAGWKTIWVRRPSDIPPSAGPEELKPEDLPEGSAPPDAIVNDLRSILRLLP